MLQAKDQVINKLPYRMMHLLPTITIVNITI